MEGLVDLSKCEWIINSRVSSIDQVARRYSNLWTAVSEADTLTTRPPRLTLNKHRFCDCGFEDIYIEMAFINEHRYCFTCWIHPTDSLGFCSSAFGQAYHGVTTRTLFYFKHTCSAVHSWWRVEWMKQTKKTEYCCVFLISVCTAKYTCPTIPVGRSVIEKSTARVRMLYSSWR